MNEGGENTNSMSKEIESDIVAIVTCIGKVKFYIALLKSLLWASWCCYELKSYIANLSAIEYFEIKKTVLPFVTSFLVLLPFFSYKNERGKNSIRTQDFPLWFGFVDVQRIHITLPHLCQWTSKSQHTKHCHNLQFDLYLCWRVRKWAWGIPIFFLFFHVAICTLCGYVYIYSARCKNMSEQMRKNQ